MFCFLLNLQKKFKPPPPSHVHVYEWPFPIPLQHAPFALPPNPIVLPTLPIPSHTSNTTSIHGTFSSSSYLTPSNEHFDLLEDPFDHIMPSIPSPSRISSSSRCSTHIIKKKTTKYKDHLANLVTIMISQLMNQP